MAVLAYWPTFSNGFINWDDDRHVTRNNQIKSLDAQGLSRIFTGTVNKIYIPLTTLTFALEYHFFKFQPFYYHLNNLLLHLGVGVLVFYWGRSLGLSWAAGLIGMVIFLVHPIHVESVAWVSERKDVLYAFFYLAAVNLYLTRPILGIDRAKPALIPGIMKDKNYWGSLFLGLLAMLAKPMALSLPLILVLCDWFKGRQDLRRILGEKIPYFFYIIPLAWLTLRLNGDSFKSGSSLGESVLIYLWSLSFPVIKFFSPWALNPVYQIPQPVALTNPPYAIGLGLTLALLISLYIFRQQRWWVFAWAQYYFSIFFLLRFGQVADRNPVADRFMYLPSVGLCLALGYAAHKIWLKMHDKIILRRCVTVGFVFLMTFMVIKTNAQCRIWNNSFLFWDHVIALDPKLSFAYYNRANAYKAEREWSPALRDYTEAIELNPSYEAAINSRGAMYHAMGLYDQALNDYNRVLQLNANKASTYNNRGNLYLMHRDFELAIQDFDRALALDPGLKEVNKNRALAIKLKDLYNPRD